MPPMKVPQLPRMCRCMRKAMLPPLILSDQGGITRNMWGSSRGRRKKSAGFWPALRKNLTASLRHCITASPSLSDFDRPLHARVQAADVLVAPDVGEGERCGLAFEQHRAPVLRLALHRHLVR